MPFFDSLYFFLHADGLNRALSAGKGGAAIHKHVSPTSFSSAPPIKPLTYAQAGVSVDAGNALVEAIKPFVKETRRPGADGKIGGFGGVFDLKAAGYSKGGDADGDDTLLVAGTDGVGTKLRIALESGIHGTVGKITH